MPTSLGHLDGTICETEKSAMMKILRNDCTLPTHTDVVIVDAFSIHSLKDVQSCLAPFPKENLQILTSYNASRVHIVFDRYCSPSIKDYECTLRGGFNSQHDYGISGPEQARTNDFGKELRNDKFKEALVLFLISHWESDDVAPLIGNKTILLNFINCYSFSVDVNGLDLCKALYQDFMSLLVLGNKKEFQKAFASLGDSSSDFDDTFARIESFVCSMYGYESNKKIDNVRYQMFLRNYKVENT
ncbi:hypothetical protein JTB14_033233 [Gonioctena quinquepunctata]|nr:hypothetical protein JTB14_033233 [Gonioctena quinquepunctata]